MTSERDSFRRVFDACYPKLMAYARRRTDAAVADDVVADTFLVAWRRRTEFLNLDRQLPWLYGVAGNQLRNHNRSADRHLRLVARAGSEPVSPTRDADSVVDALVDAERVRQALGTLSFDDQEVLRLIAWEELSYAEAAVALDCSTDALGQRLRRAKQRLANALTQPDTTTEATSPEATSTLSSDHPITEVR
ncbi:MAG: RNA polymerase sigma factor [Acidimicrobiia bacterium]|nr:RNA polymerase sigma factor [Acidimicrobiia bacterium]